MKVVPERFFDPRTRPRSLREAVEGYMRSSGLARLCRHPKLYLAWRDVVGEDLVEHTRVVALAKGVLEVEVDSSALLHHLAGFQKGQLLRSFREKKPGLFVRDIQFKIGSFER